MKISYLFFIALFIFSGSSKDDNLYVIDPRTFIERKITLADIADDIKYIPLDNSIPFINLNCKITPNSIYVSTKGTGIFKFDRQGKLIKKIGRQGRGPGEFMFGIDFTVDEKTGNVFVIDQPNITKVYSQNGTFIRDISLNKIGEGAGFGADIEIFNSLLFYPNSLGQGNSKYSWAFLDTLGNLVSRKENSVPPFQTRTGREACIYKFENKLFYYNFFNDTIFSISPDLSYNAEYLFAQGDYRYPTKTIEQNSISQYQNQLSKIFQPGKMFETMHFIVLPFAYQHKLAILFIDKKTKRMFEALKYENIPGSIAISKDCLINDLDGGPPLESLSYYSENKAEYITTLINPFKLKLYIHSSEFINSLPKYPNKKIELEKLANSLKETDNPVLLIVKLKK